MPQVPPGGFAASQPYQTVGYQGPSKTSGMAIASLVCGLIPCTCIPSLLAIIFGHIALSAINKSGGQLRGRGLATWGLVLGYIFTVANLVYGIVVGIKNAGM